jgi:hypothetical protein
MGEEELHFQPSLCSFAIYRFVLDVYGQEVFFEPDEERNYRALIDAAHLESNKKISVDLLQAIAEGIEAILK